jgi:oligoribonuclease
MKYLSLDIETTGLDKQNAQIIQVAVVVDDMVTPVEKLPRFVSFIDHELLRFEPYALEMHRRSGLLERYLAEKGKSSLNQVFEKLNGFLQEHYELTGKAKYNVAGKNVAGFDLPFIAAEMADQADIFLGKCSHRVIDPGTAFTDFYSDKSVVNLDDCKKRARVFSAPVSHDALDDALDVVNVVREIAANNRGRFIEAPYVTNT